MMSRRSQLRSTGQADFADPLVTEGDAKTMYFAREVSFMYNRMPCLIALWKVWRSGHASIAEFFTLL
jgi:hypothetical protein